MLVACWKGQEDSHGNYRTYHFDLRGSTVALTDLQERVTNSFQYDPYGKLIKKTGETSTPFLYAGQYGVMTDANGLYYMRARYYNPEISRFISRDVMQGSIDNGSSLNRYAYVNGNPILYIDPLGLSPMDSGGTSSGIDSIGQWVMDFLLGNTVSIDNNMNFGIAQGIAGYRPNIDSTAFTLGKISGDIISLYEGLASVAGGIGGEAGGTTLDATGIGAIVGVPLNVVSAAAVAYGGAVIGNSAVSASNDAMSLFSRFGNSGTGDMNASANKLNHIFGKSEHNLDSFVKSFGGDQSKAYQAIQDATQQYVNENNITGIFEEVVNVNGTNITVRGKVVNGEVKIGTAFIP